MKDEKVFYRKKDIIKILADLNMMIVSLDRIGSYYTELNDDEKFNAISSDFLTDWDVCRKLAHARKTLDSAFSYDLGDDEMGELEREFQDLQYWSLKNPKPLKK
jgi:hypothetical protein